MMLVNFILRLLAIVAISGEWGPAVCMDENLQIINYANPDPAAISAADKTPDEKNAPDVVSSTLVNSKVIRRSAIDTKELTKIFNIAYSNNESRVLQLPLNHYELPDGEWVRRDFRSVKMHNVDAQSQKKEFSSDPLVTDNSQNGEVQTHPTFVPGDYGNSLCAKGNVLNELLTDVSEVSDAMVNTMQFFASTLQNQFQTSSSKGFESDNTEKPGLIIALTFICSLCLCILLYIFHKTLLTLVKKCRPLDCKYGNDSCTMRELYLRNSLENDHTISQTDGNENEELNDNKNSSPPAPVSEALEEAQKV